MFVYVYMVREITECNLRLPVQVQSGYPGCMVYLVLAANCIRQAVSLLFPALWNKWRQQD